MDSNKETIQPNNEAPRARGTYCLVSLFLLLWQYLQKDPKDPEWGGGGVGGGGGWLLDKVLSGEVQFEVSEVQSLSFQMLQMVPLLLCILVHGGMEYCMTPARAAAKETISIAT